MHRFASNITYFPIMLALGLMLSVTKPRPIMLNFLPIMLLSNAQKYLPIMLNIMLMTTEIMPQFVYDFILFND